jgi:hypothetical protein
MIIKIPLEIEKQLQWDTIDDVNKIIDTAFDNKNDTLLAWAIYSKAEYLLLQRSPSPNDIIEAFKLYEAITTFSDDILKQVGMLGMAEYYFMEWGNHPADIGRAYRLYEYLLCLIRHMKLSSGQRSVKQNA